MSSEKNRYRNYSRSPTPPLRKKKKKKVGRESVCTDTMRSEESGPSDSKRAELINLNNHNLGMSRFNEGVENPDQLKTRLDQDMANPSTADILLQQARIAESMAQARNLGVPAFQNQGVLPFASNIQGQSLLQNLCMGLISNLGMNINPSFMLNTMSFLGNNISNPDTQSMQNSVQGLGNPMSSAQGFEPNDSLEQVAHGNLGNPSKDSSIADEAEVVVVPDGSGCTKYPAPDPNTLTLDPSIGYRFDPRTGLHFDANSGYFFNSKRRVFLYWDFMTQTYLKLQNPSIPFPNLKNQKQSADEEHSGTVKDEKDMEISSRSRKGSRSGSRDQAQSSGKRRATRSPSIKKRSLSGSSDQAQSSGERRASRSPSIKKRSRSGSSDQARTSGKRRATRSPSIKKRSRSGSSDQAQTSGKRRATRSPSIKKQELERSSKNKSRSSKNAEQTFPDYSHRKQKKSMSPSPERQRSRSSDNNIRCVSRKQSHSTTSSGPSKEEKSMSISPDREVSRPKSPELGFKNDHKFGFCFKCGLSGHDKESCTLAGKLCYGCKKVTTHSAGECPLNKIRSQIRLKKLQKLEAHLNELDKVGAKNKLPRLEKIPIEDETVKTQDVEVKSELVDSKETEHEAGIGRTPDDSMPLEQSDSQSLPQGVSLQPPLQGEPFQPQLPQGQLYQAQEYPPPNPQGDLHQPPIQQTWSYPPPISQVEVCQPAFPQGDSHQPAFQQTWSYPPPISQVEVCQPAFPQGDSHQPVFQQTWSYPPPLSQVEVCQPAFPQGDSHQPAFQQTWSYPPPLTQEELCHPPFPQGDSHQPPFQQTWSYPPPLSQGELYQPPFPQGGSYQPPLQQEDTNLPPLNYGALVKCTKCGMYGHGKKFCTVSGRLCYFCKTVSNHISANCPLKNQHPFPQEGSCQPPLSQGESNQPTLQLEEAEPPPLPQGESNQPPLQLEEAVPPPSPQGGSNQPPLQQEETNQPPPKSRQYVQCTKCGMRGHGTKFCTVSGRLCYSCKTVSNHVSANCPLKNQHPFPQGESNQPTLQLEDAEPPPLPQGESNQPTLQLEDAEPPPLPQGESNQPTLQLEEAEPPPSPQGESNQPPLQLEEAEPPPSPQGESYQPPLKQEDTNQPRPKFRYYVKCTKCGMRGHGTKFCTVSGKFCYSCKTVSNHISANCPLNTQHPFPQEGSCQPPFSQGESNQPTLQQEDTNKPPPKYNPFLKCKKCKVRGHRSKDCRQCFICNTVSDHITANCPLNTQHPFPQEGSCQPPFSQGESNQPTLQQEDTNKPPPKYNPFLKCRKCKVRGHRSKDCRQCFICNTVSDHITANCPLKNQKHTKSPTSTQMVKIPLDVAKCLDNRRKETGLKPLPYVNSDISDVALINLDSLNENDAREVLSVVGQMYILDRKNEHEQNLECQNCSEIGHTGENCPKFGKKCYHCQQQNHVSKQCPLKKRNPVSVTKGGNQTGQKCFNCSGIGHTKANCPKIGKRCNHCQQQNHVSKQCPLKKRNLVSVTKGENQTGQKCFNCKKIGHTKANCPTIGKRCRLKKRKRNLVSVPT